MNIGTISKFFSSQGLSAQPAEESSSASAQKTARGRALMLERLWRITDPSAPEPKVLSVAYPSTCHTSDFLTYDDRKLLAKAYSYAEEKNIGLEKIDLLAFDLSGYRMTQASGGLNPNKPGTMWTLDGKWIINAFDERDTKIAYQIQNGKAIQSTQFDKGFLNGILDPEKSPAHGTDFAFLASMVKEFSDQAGQPDENIQMPDDPNRRYAEPGEGCYLVETVNGQKPPSHPDNLAKDGEDGSSVLSYLTRQDRKKLLAAYQLLMSLGMSTDQLDQTATWLGATRMRETTGAAAPANSSASTGDKATRAYSGQDIVTSLLDSLHPANRQKTHQPQIPKVLKTLLIAERAEAEKD